MKNKTKIDLNGRTILVTGSPGFIGANLVLRLLHFTAPSGLHSVLERPLSEAKRPLIFSRFDS